MKKSNAKRLRAILTVGMEAAKGMRPPPDGMMISLGDETLQNGWHYQVAYVYDTRVHKRPYVIVYGFKPPLRMSARSADIYAEHCL